ncbi:hypothetical protein KKF38_01655 [Patescibacteria group bacterium]|nr:hypothetical protein [Patescibacteria group bacterium]
MKTEIYGEPFEKGFKDNQREQIEKTASVQTDQPLDPEVHCWDIAEDRSIWDPVYEKHR